MLLQVTCSFNASAPWAEANKLWEQASVQRLPEQEQGALGGGRGGGVTRDAALMFLLREWPRCPRAPSAPGQHLAPLFASHLLGNVS